MENINPNDRAKEIHDVITNKIAHNMSTIAVLTTNSEVVIVGTSESKLRNEQRKILKENELEAESITGNHAEENAIAEAKKQHLTGIEIGVSREICIDCQELIEKEEIISHTAFSGKKSTKRKS